MTAYTKVPKHFQPVPKEEFEATYMKDAELVKKYIGSLYTQNHFDSSPCISHQQMSTLFGAFAMYLMSESSYRFWTHDDYKDQEKWQRIIWRVAHVYSLGFLVSHRKFMLNVNSPSWNPALHSLEDFTQGKQVTIYKSNRPLCGGVISLAVYLNIFGYATEFEDNNVVNMALIDTFSASPNSDNPIFVTLRRSLRAILFDYNYKLPYFWHESIVYLLGSMETELTNYLKLVNQDQLSNEDFDLSQHLSVFNSASGVDKMKSEMDTLATAESVDKKAIHKATDNENKAPLVTPAKSDNIDKKTPKDTEQNLTILTIDKNKLIDTLSSQLNKFINDKIIVNDVNGLFYFYEQQILLNHPNWLLLLGYNKDVVNPLIERLLGVNAIKVLDVSENNRNFNVLQLSKAFKSKLTPSFFVFDESTTLNIL